MAPGRLPAIVIVVCGGIATAAAVGQPSTPRATESEMLVLRQAFGLDREFDRRDQVLGLEGWQYSNSDGSYDLVGFLWLKPVFVQGAICIAAEYALKGRPTGENPEWSSQQRFHHWLGQSDEECLIESRDDLPDSVETNGSIPTDAMVLILEGERELVRQTLEFEVAEECRERPSEWRLLGVRLSEIPLSELGFAYFVQFKCPGISGGPSVTVTIENGELRVHGAEYWLA